MMRILVAILLVCCCWSETVFVTPKGGTVTYKEREVVTFTLEKALELQAQHIQILPGVYNIHCEIKYGGKPDEPVTIRGGHGVKFCGNTKPGERGKPAFLIENQQWIVLENMHFAEYWNTAILIRSSHYITVRHCGFIGACWPIFARGDKTHHLLIEDNDWVQDPSGDMWRKIPWAESHHGTHGFYNGSLLGGKEILGSIVFRRNKIAFAYNGIRIVGNRKEAHIDNFNVEVYDNRFEYIRDNPVEPEGSASNWWIHHNEFYNCYALLSFTNVAGEKWYVFRNVGWWDEAPGGVGGHNRGKIFKFSSEGPYPRGEFWAFHNSWYSRSPLLMGGTTRYFSHYNNAVFFTQKVAVAEGDADSTEEYPIWDKSYDFDHNIFNLPYLKKTKSEEHSIVADVKFRNAGKGDFTLLEKSPAIDRGKILQLNGWQSDFLGDAPDMGAFEGERCLPGPPFRFMATKYDERPRIVRVEQKNKLLIITFSTLLKEGKVVVEVVNANGRHKTHGVVNKAVIECELTEKITIKDDFYLPANIFGKNGLAITLWSCNYKNLHLMSDLTDTKTSE